MNVSQVSVPFNSPVRMPNGLQWYEDELYVMDQLTDDVFVLDVDGAVKRVITTETVNGSGITVGGGFIWTACNSRNGATARPQRPTDYHTSNVRKVDPVTGETIDYFPTPDGGGIHGIEYDEGNIWITAFEPKALVLIDGTTYEVIKQFPCELNVLHGLVDQGNTVIVIEHNLDVIKSSDWIIDLGPEGGIGGGTIIGEGSPKNISKIKESYTGQFLQGT